MKIKLKPFEVELAANTATRRFIENLKMGKSFLMAIKDLMKRL